MLRDRGSIKWVSMMLPEHVELLREYHESLQKLKNRSWMNKNMKNLMKSFVKRWQKTECCNLPIIGRGK